MNECKYFQFKESIVVNVKNKTIIIHKNDPRYDKVIKAIDDKAYEAIPLLADNETTEELRNLLKVRSKKVKK